MKRKVIIKRLVSNKTNDANWNLKKENRSRGTRNDWCLHLRLSTPQKAIGYRLDDPDLIPGSGNRFSLRYDRRELFLDPLIFVFSRYRELFPCGKWGDRPRAKLIMRLHVLPRLRNLPVIWLISQNNI